MPVADPDAEPGAWYNSWGLGIVLITLHIPYVFVVWEVIRMNILNIVFWLQLRCMQILQLMQKGVGTGTASAFACVLNRSNVEE